MIYGLILLGIWLALNAIIIFKDFVTIASKNITDEITLIIGLPIMTGLACCIFLMPCMPIRNSMLAIYDSSDTIPIVSVRSNSGINGVFVWGSGSINNVEQYVCYKQVDGMIKQVILNASDTWIIEDVDSSNANIERRYVIYDKTTALYKWFYIGKNKPWLYENYLHVPKGSVVYQYNIN
jgi:hypothetical protein